MTPARRTVLALLAAGATAAGTAGAAEVFVTVSNTNNTYAPSVVFIQPGDTVTWTFAGGPMPHNVQADDGSFQKQAMSTPWTFSHLFPDPGTWRYYCVVHGGPGGSGMSGQVIVGARTAWAPQDAVITLGAWDFSARTAPGAWGSAATPPFHRTGSAAGEILVAGVPLPSGDQITSLEIAGCDNGAGSLTARLYRCLDPEYTCTAIATVTASGTPACGFSSVAVTNVTNGTVDNFAYSYAVEVQMGASQSLRAVRVFHRRRASPGPVTATFADVPTTDSRFRYVEALVAAGITGGCGGGNFCPDSPVTRGQMAVFLAVALDLFWAN
jgi:plastocyanin